MCDFFMEANKGDLADIVWAGNNSTGPPPTTDTWHLAPDPVDFPPSSQNLAQDLFGDPFSHTRDPLLHELPGMEFFTGPDRPVGPAQEANNEMIMKRPCNLFSRILQISPGMNTHKASSSPLISPRERKPSPIMVARESLVGCHVDHGSGMQISSSSSSSSPRTPGIKRRKSQAKKVVCIPAPAAATSRPSTGEVVPSDLWAWRKYGQKPIKGSPYPRGYYRCSSSKGCSARKQVERSRTDPNMLVITYTSEHNHPWPTQRNALAGSTRSSQPAKNNNTSSASKGSQPACLKEEPMDLAVSSSTSVMVKEEVVEMEKTTLDDDFDQVLIHESYKPMIPADLDQPDDFFADLAELEPDPMSLIFSKGSYSDKLSDESKAMDPFTIFDQWAGNSFGESKKGL